MSPKNDSVISVDDVMDVVLHDEIKLRAYQLYERQRDDSEDLNRSNELKSELLLVAYAAAQLQKDSHGEVRDTKAVRAARVYLRALSAFIGQA